MIIVFNLFLTSVVSKICCFSEIVAVIWEAILSAISDGSFNCFIVLIVSFEIFLLIEVSFSNLLKAVVAKGYKSSSFEIMSLLVEYSQVINFSLSSKFKILTLLTPSTKTLTVPSGNFKS